MRCWRRVTDVGKLAAASSIRFALRDVLREILFIALLCSVGRRKWRRIKRGVVLIPRNSTTCGDLHEGR